MGKGSTSDELNRLRTIYARMAGRYDRSMRRWERVLFGGDRRWAAGQAVGTVLELGVGTGRNLPYYPPTVSLIGIDLSEAMLDLARGRAEKLGRSVQLCAGDAQAVALPDHSVDSVVITFALCTIPDPVRALAEARRLLRPGGRLLLVEHVLSTNALVGILQRLAEPLAARLQGDHLTRDPEPLVSAAGLIVQETQRHGAGVVLRLRAERPRP